MKSKNPRHNSVRIVRRDYCYSGTCQCQCSALEDITSVYQCKNYILFFKKMHFVKKKRQNKIKSQIFQRKRTTEKSDLYLKFWYSAGCFPVQDHSLRFFFFTSTLFYVHKKREDSSWCMIL